MTRTTALEADVAAAAENIMPIVAATADPDETPKKDGSSRSWFGNLFSPSEKTSDETTASTISTSTSSSSLSSLFSKEEKPVAGSVWSNFKSALVDGASRTVGVEMDSFDDSHSLTVDERNRRRMEQRQTLTTATKLESISRTVPAYIPPNIPAEQLVIPETHLTTLPNGLRVVSQETYGQICTVGIVSDFGSRHEGDDKMRGITHLLELASFGASGSNYQSAETIAHQLQEWGGSRFVSSGREQTILAIDLLRPNAQSAVAMLSDVVLQPKFLPHELDQAKESIRFANSMPDTMPPELLLSEALQTAAYGSDQQLGQPYLCTVEALEVLGQETALAHWEAHFATNPQGMVLGGAGVSHGDLVAWAEQYFGHLVQDASVTPNPSSSNTSIDQNKTIASRTPTIPSVYRGGDCFVTIPIIDSTNDPAIDGADAQQEQMPLSVVSEEQRLTRVAVGLEVGGWHSKDLVAICVLQTLLGGGSSFSAGGPGKGMYSRLYRQILNRFNWAESTEAFSSFHNETGLMGIAGSTQALHARDMVRAFCFHLTKLADEKVTQEELNRARNMLKNNVLTQLESRLVLFEDMSRQVLTYGKREDARATCEKIEAVTAEEIQAIVQQALMKPPTIAAVGVDVSTVPTQEQVVQILRNI